MGKQDDRKRSSDGIPGRIRAELARLLPDVTFPDKDDEGRCPYSLDEITRILDDAAPANREAARRYLGMLYGGSNVPPPPELQGDTPPT